jgi:hypothetical protein
VADDNASAKKIWTFLFSKSWITWIGHGVMMAALLAATILFGAVGTGGIFLVYFGVRETKHFKEGKPPFDCIMDFAVPAVVYLLYVKFLY